MEQTAPCETAARKTVSGDAQRPRQKSRHLSPLLKYENRDVVMRRRSGAIPAWRLGISNFIADSGDGVFKQPGHT